ncbi:MAG: GGDEF domain-containing protein [Haliea sp.]
MAALIALFILGYLGYLAAFWESHSTLVDLIVPYVFFSGACFVLLAAILSLRTAMDVLRISRLEWDVATDPLTKIFNRRYLDRRLNEEITRAWRYGLPLAILMLDIDHFKRINDRHGHQAGDEVLIALVKIVAGALREADVFTRYGGEEFLIIAPHTSLSGATDLAERVREYIEAHDFKLPNQPDRAPGIKVTVSIGVASIGAGAGDRETLIHAADTNLLRAKTQGRNRVIAGGLGAKISTVSDDHCTAVHQGT